MNKREILFSNEPFMAHVVGKGELPIRCVPVVFDAPTACGVGVLYENGTAQVWGLVSPRDLIAAWRATEVLRRLDAIEDDTLCAAYYTGLRDPGERDMKSYFKPIISKIGRKAYSEIMAMPVPEQIIRSILDNQRGDFAPSLYPITDEVRAGTLEWRDEFAAAGVVHPDEADAVVRAVEDKRRKREATIAKFEKQLASYAKMCDLPRQCVGMWELERSLVLLVEQDMSRTYPNEVLVALAGVLSTDEGLIGAAALFGGDHKSDDFKAQAAKLREKVIECSATWLAANSRPSDLAFWKRRKHPLTNASAKRLLVSLYDRQLSAKTEAANT